MTISELKLYIISEATKLYQKEILKEQKLIIEKEISLLSECQSIEEIQALKKMAEEMRKKATGWSVPEALSMLSEKKYSDKASKVIGKEISHLQKDKGYPHDRAVAAAINVAKDKGFKIPKPTNEIDKSAMKAAKRDIEYDGHKFEPLGKNKFEKHLDKKELRKAMSPGKK